jgi:hypothetical protein
LVSGEDNSLFNAIGDERMEGAVTLLPEGQICITLDGYRQDKCVEKSRVLNLEEEVLGVQPKNPAQWEVVHVAAVEYLGIKGILIDPPTLPEGVGTDPTSTPTRSAPGVTTPTPEEGDRPKGP